MMSVLQVTSGDITTLNVDAIVNAANEWMLGGGGVDGAIHAAAGPELREACRSIPETRPGVRCPTGEARITPGFRLPARFVIHTVGPVWRGGRFGETDLLTSCYRNSLRLTEEYRLRSIAFPPISCGAFGYPLLEGCEVAVLEISAALLRESTIDEAHLVAVEADVEQAFKKAIRCARK